MEKGINDAEPSDLVISSNYYDKHGVYHFIPTMKRLILMLILEHWHFKVFRV